MIIIADTLVTRAGRTMHNGALVIRSGGIVASGNGKRMLAKYPGHRVMRLNRSVLMPGLVNVHAHLELPALHDRIQGKDYSSWVLGLLKAKTSMAFSDYVAASRSNIASLIRSGTTTVAEVCTHGASPPVLASSGLRAVVYHEIISMAHTVSKPLLPRPERSRRLMRQGLSPHSPHTVSEAVLVAIKRYALRRGLPITMHVAETNDEMRLLQGRRSGLERLYAAAGWKTEWAPRARSSFEFLLRTGILGRSFLAVHAVHADADDIAIIKRSGACVAHCPRSNSGMHVGTMPLAKFLRANIPVGIGTDSLASVPTLNLWDEMRYALRVHGPSGVTAANILGMATLGGAKAIGLEKEIGSLDAGKRADCIAVPLPARDTGDLSSDLLRETKSCMMSMVNGKIIYQLSSAQPK